MVARIEAFIEAGCNHIVWADGSPDPFIVPPVAAAALATLRQRHGGDDYSSTGNVTRDG